MSLKTVADEMGTDCTEVSTELSVVMSVISLVRCVEAPDTAARKRVVADQISDANCEDAVEISVNIPDVAVNIL